MYSDLAEAMKTAEAKTRQVATEVLEDTVELVDVDQTDSAARCAGSEAATIVWGVTGQDGVETGKPLASLSRRTLAGRTR